MVLGAALLAALLGVGYQVLGIGQVEPDFQFAYIGGRLLPDETAAALETALAGLREDRNGDGQVVVQFNQYMDGAASDNEDAAMYAYASSARLMADLQHGDSYFFLLENPERFQRNYEVLTEEPPLLWTDCPALAALPLGGYTEPMTGETGDSQAFFSGLYLARRGFWTEKQTAYAESCGGLWRILTEGAAA